MEAVRKLIKKKDKKHRQRSLCMAAYLQDKPDISFDEYEFIYRADKHDKDKEEDEVTELPVRLAIGVTMVLAGGFLIGVGIFLKIPICTTSGQALFWSGINFAVEGAVNSQDEEKEKDKKK